MPPTAGVPRYTSTAAVRDLLAPNGDPAGTAAVLELEAISAEIESAEDRIDAELAGRYGRYLPFDPVPGIVARIARDIASYNCDLAYRGAAAYGFADYDPILMRYRDAVRLLERIGAGLMDLAVTVYDDSTGGGAGGRAGRPRQPRGRLFGGELLDPLYRDPRPVAGRYHRVVTDEPWRDW